MTIDPVVDTAAAAVLLGLKPRVFLKRMARLSVKPIGRGVHGMSWSLDAVVATVDTRDRLVTTQDLADQWGVTPDAASKWLRRHGIGLASTGPNGLAMYRTVDVLAARRNPTRPLLKVP